SQADLNKALNAVHDAFFTDLKKTLHLFCLGTGSIGSTLFKQSHPHAHFLEAQNGIQIRLVGLSNTRKMLLNRDGISLENWEQELNEQGGAADLPEFIRQMKAMNLPNGVFADNTASSEPVKFYSDIFQSNI